MADTLELKVVTPGGNAVEATVTSFTARSTVGEFSVLPGHALLLTSIAAGKMTAVLEAGETETFALDNGFLEAGPAHVHVITDHCVAADDVDEDATRSEIVSLEEQLRDDTLDPATRNTLTRKLAWAGARLSLTE